MKIVVSGGWGYGNIGDDALLEATYRLLRKAFPKAEIVWTSYDTEFTRESCIFQDSEIVVPSVHRVLAGGRAFWDLSTVGRSPNLDFVPRLVRRAIMRFIFPLLLGMFKIWRGWLWKVWGKARCVRLFEGCNLFIMSGGGYFNMWETMFEARLCELKLAHEARSGVLLLGQSIGPFSFMQQVRVRQELCSTDKVVVRDEESLRELAMCGVSANLLPDLAFSLEPDKQTLKDCVCIIPAELRKEQVDVLASELTHSECLRYSVVITITRQIYPDIQTAKWLKAHLLQHNPHLSVELRFPKTYQEMRHILDESRWVLSRGLHAMILSWCAGACVFALTTSRKVNAFLTLIGQGSESQCKEVDWDGNLHRQLDRWFANTAGRGGSMNTWMRQRELSQAVSAQVFSLLGEFQGTMYHEG